jgi:hypothetical protein
MFATVIDSNFRVVGVRYDGTEATLGKNLTKSHAEAVKQALCDPRIFAGIRLIPEAGFLRGAPVTSLLIESDPDCWRAAQS